MKTNLGNYLHFLMILFFPLDLVGTQKKKSTEEKERKKTTGKT